MELAYSAFNCPYWIEFILRVPTPISDEAVPGRLTYSSAVVSIENCTAHRVSGSSVW